METTERVVEAYVRYVKGWATIPNVKCAGQYEIDLIAIDPVSLSRYHIEVGVHIASGFKSLTARPFSATALKERVQGPAQRRTLGFYLERKFGPREVRDKLKEYGFEENSYGRVIVSWGWTEEAAEQAQAAGVQLWDFRTLLKEMANLVIGAKRQYFPDDTLRTLHLFCRASTEESQESGTEANS